MSFLYPWHHDAWQRVQTMRSSGRIPHALLITGHQGTGISEFASRLATSILCTAPSTLGELCGQCQGCVLLKANTHPELLIIAPEEEGKNIKVDQIRQLMEFTQLKSHFTHHKVIIIEPADAMNTNANNSLLKTLEEPPGETLLILVTHQPAMLPTTVRSRCQRIKISASSVHVRDWLSGKYDPELIDSALAIGYGPLFLEENDDIDLHQNRLALLDDLEGIRSGHRDPLDVAESWSKMDVHQIFFWLMKILQDLIKLKLIETSSLLANKDLIERLNKLSELTDINKFVIIYDRLFMTNKLLAINTNVKPQTLCEEFTLNWVNAKRTS